MNFYDAIEGILIPFFEDLGFSHKITRSSPDENSVSFQKGNIELYYRDLNRLDDPYVGIFINEQRYSYAKLVARYFGSEKESFAQNLGGWASGGLNIPSYEITCNTIVNTFEKLVEAVLNDPSFPSTNR